ncbi:YdcF family protein [Halioglobus maricola]|uniref:YdcF family protein n=1 Tax=Halioglobus maricola TaxID=2601894 RepID=A0A5P9NGG4_9GAMM|nr:YdcF family protein [Halioglobus maricola]
MFVFPLSQAIVLVLAGLLCIKFAWHRTGKASILLGITWLYVCSTGLFADWLMGNLEDDYRPKIMSVVPRAGAIVVLGGGTRGDTHWSSYGDLNQAADRLLHAVDLYKSGKAPLVIVSGGAAPGDRSEADIMEQILVVMGVPARAILKESNSRDTHENAVFSAVLLNGKNIDKIHLVTSAWHMRRAEPLFTRQGFEVIPAPTDYQRLVGAPAVPPFLPTVDDLARTTSALKEYVGYLVYRYRGWL